MPRRQPPLSIAVIAAAGLRQRCRAILARADGPPVRSRGVGLARAPHLLRRYRPSVLLLDTVASPRRALGALPILKRLSPTTGIILLGKNGTPVEAVLEGVRRGAWGHLTERDLPQSLPRAVRTVAAREPWLPRGLGAALVAELRAIPQAPARRPSARLRLIRGGADAGSPLANRQGDHR